MVNDMKMKMEMEMEMKEGEGYKRDACHVVSREKGVISQAGSCCVGGSLLHEVIEVLLVDERETVEPLVFVVDLTDEVFRSVSILHEEYLVFVSLDQGDREKFNLQRTSHFCHVPSWMQTCSPLIMTVQLFLQFPIQHKHLPNRTSSTQ